MFWHHDGEYCSERSKPPTSKRVTPARSEVAGGQQQEKLHAAIHRRFETRMKHWEIIADNRSKADWSLGLCLSD
ncbi:MAG: hypothetical protein DME98_01880 [Verrucomicrobia bacterium]|nr:MAG: hypothetical protein DME98_01880 [Verrucomicrobiota bacterium]PYJ34854.1 MAG: hypothetical protein DME88_03680 [Verrucomicrobiota bacterium]